MKIKFMVSRYSVLSAETELAFLGFLHGRPHCWSKFFFF